MKTTLDWAEMLGPLMSSSCPPSTEPLAGLKLSTWGSSWPERWAEKQQVYFRTLLQISVLQRKQNGEGNSSINKHAVYFCLCVFFYDRALKEHKLPVCETHSTPRESTPSAATESGRPAEGWRPWTPPAPSCSSARCPSLLSSARCRRYAASGCRRSRCYEKKGTVYQNASSQLLTTCPHVDQSSRSVHCGSGPHSCQLQRRLCKVWSWSVGARNWWNKIHRGATHLTTNTSAY